MPLAYIWIFSASFSTSCEKQITSNQSDAVSDLEGEQIEEESGNGSEKTDVIKNFKGTFEIFLQKSPTD